jgi:putative nucleotidyltransferase with HDIG domain
MRDLRIPDSSPPGDDGTRSISPFRGRVQPTAQPLTTVATDGGGFRIGVYALGLATAAVALAASLAFSGYALSSFWAIVPLAVLGVAAERHSVSLTGNLEVSISLLPMLFAAVALGPLEAMVVGAASMLGGFHPPYLRWAVYTSTSAINGGLTGLVAVFVASVVPNPAGAIAVATLVGALSAQALDIAFAALTLVVRRTGTASGLLRISTPAVPTSVLLYTAIVAPLAFAFLEISPWTLLFFLLPGLAAQRLWVMYQEQRRLAADLAVVNDRLEQANLSFASALVTTLDARDRYTAGHSAAVAVYARDIAARLGLPPDEQQLAHLSGLLHDIGKIGVPPGILEKNGPLTLQERRKMEEHSVIGERILANVEAYAEIAEIVRHHHERIDGEGYPDGLVLNQIPMISRIICVADAYNAMTSDRPYRDAMPFDVARARLRQAAGTQFDASVVAAFDFILENASATYSSGARADFALEAQAHPELASSTTASAA